MNATTNVHTHCIESIPQWLAGRLAVDETAKLAEHVRTCADCRAELDVARRLRAQFEREWRDAAPLTDARHAEAQFDRLWGRIAAATTEPARRPIRGRIPIFTTLAATVLIGAALTWYQGAARNDFRTLAEGPPLRCIALRVELATPPTDALRRALQSTGATIIERRSSDHAYVLTAPDPTAASRALRALPGVSRVEPVDC